VSDRAGLTAALTAGGVAMLAAALPLKLGLVAAAIAGVLGGLAVEWRRQ
jgi:ribonuclease PH